MSARFDPVINGAPPPIVISGPSNDHVASNGGRDSPDAEVQRTDSVKMPVVMAGTLQKMGRRLKRWTPRYFELQGSKLHYYKNPSKHEYLGAIDLKICYSATLSPIVSFGSTFELQTLDRVHILAARAREDRERWLNAIKEKMMPSKEVAEEKRNTRRGAPTRRWLSFKEANHTEQTAAAKVVRKESLMERFFSRKSRRKLSTEERPATSLGHTQINDHHTLSVSTPSSPIVKRQSLEGAISVEASPEPWSPFSTLERNMPSPSSICNSPAPQSPAPQSPAPQSSAPQSPAPQSPASTLPLAPSALPDAMPLPSSAAVSELRELLNSLPESKVQLSYDSWPPLADEDTWMGQPTAIEQLRHFLVSCP